MTRGQAVLHRLAAGLQTSARHVIVCAHPDDETLGLGGSLGLMPDAVILQLTDGGAGSMASRRRAEREAAFQAAGWRVPVVECGVTDQQVHAHVAALLDVVMLRLASADVVWTHPYEGGHPDHDAAACLVQVACDRLDRSGSPVPERFEFASYHWNGSARVAGTFYPAADPTVIHVALAGERLAAKQRALEAYETQAFIRRWFHTSEECYRPAPRYDFTMAPPVPGCLYERKRWPVTNAAWRAAVARVA